jgi:CRP-like cAMP-binding protein
MKLAPFIPQDCSRCPNRLTGVCGAVSDSETAALESAKGSDRAYRGGAIVLHQGNETRDYHRVLDGWIGLFHTDENGDRRMLEVLMRGDGFGNLTSENPSSVFSAECLTDASICAIPHARLRGLIKRYPDVGIRISDLADDHRDRWHRHLAAATKGSAAARTAAFLTELNERALRRFNHAAEDGIILPLRQSDIAQALGLTHIYINSVLKLLSQSGAIHLGRGKVRVSNSKILRGFAESDDFGDLNSMESCQPPRQIWR